MMGCHGYSQGAQYGHLHMMELSHQLVICMRNCHNKRIVGIGRHKLGLLSHLVYSLMHIWSYGEIWLPCYGSNPQSLHLAVQEINQYQGCQKSGSSTFLIATLLRLILVCILLLGHEVQLHVLANVTSRMSTILTHMFRH